MSEYGLKIKNIEAATLYEYNNGVRGHYEYKDAIFANSLFQDYLKKNGLKTRKDGSTRDLICLEFNYGSRSYENELNHLYTISKNAYREQITADIKRDPNLIDTMHRKQKKIAELMKKAYWYKNNYQDNTTEMIRNKFYRDGVDVEYISKNKNGEIKKREKLHYTMLYRSTGKAKKGSCMFIKDALYHKAVHFLRMGIQLPKTNPMIVELGAYSPLVSSAIAGTVEINPQNILILQDIDCAFSTNVISVETDEDKHCTAKPIRNYELKNTLFDGQALIDSSIFPDWGNGYILLRHHFCKMAAFHTNIQQFFKDYFKEGYDSATVKDMFGVKHFVKDITLITTDNAMKWLKFDISYKYWCRWVNKNNNMFGIVKTAHASKLGNVQKMSYQMVNALDVNIMDQVVKESVDYIHKLKSDDGVFLDYLQKNSNFSNDYEALAALCHQNKDFVRSSYFRERKKYIIKSYVLNMKSGKLLQNADNLTIVGSPYAMLLYAAFNDPKMIHKDDTFSMEPGAIQCYTGRFPDGAYLAEFRSPFNGRNNMGYLHNVSHEKLTKYFNFGTEVIAVNMIHTDFQDRNNGSDQDSDSIYVTDQPQITQHARYCYLNYPTIVNNIPKESKEYQNTMDCFSQIDHTLSKSQLAIGESSNLAQLALTYSYHFNDNKYKDDVCILSVLAQVAIDSAKRRFDIDLDGEIKRIKKELDVKKNGYPSFWNIIKKEFNGTVNTSLICPMSYLYDLKLKEYKSAAGTLPMSHFFVKHELDVNKRACRKVEALIQKYSLNLYHSLDEDDEKFLLLRSDFEELIRDISQTAVSNNYMGLMSWLIDRAFVISPEIKRNQKKLISKLNSNRSLLLKTLYRVNKDAFLSVFSKKS